jgi:hypothetical protein
MAYCTYTELTQLTGSALSQSVLEAIIAQADREIDGILVKENLSGSATGLIKAASLELSIAGVITRHRMDGTMPSSITLGGLTMADNLDAQISQHRSNGLMYVQNYIDENSSYKDESWVFITNG